MLISGINMVNNRTDVLMLGAMKDAEAVGIYHVASRGAQLIIFCLSGCQRSSGTHSCQLIRSGQYATIAAHHYKERACGLFISLCLTVSLIVGGSRFLSLFGGDFMQGYRALAILSVGWLVNALQGRLVYYSS